MFSMRRLNPCQRGGTPSFRGSAWRAMQRPATSQGRSRRAPAAQAGPTDCLCLDFDGVLVDSEPEVSASAYAAAAEYWPAVFAGASPAQRQAVTQALRRTRPVLVRGYESCVMARLLFQDPGSEAAILGDWAALLPATLDAWGEDWERLQRSFEAHRAGWLQRDRQAWLDCNRPYPGVRDALQSCEHPFYIASSKAGHRVSTLLQEQLGLSIAEDSPRLFASLIPPEERKAAALREIAARPLVAEHRPRLHFVDDRLDTLLAIAAQPDLADWRLYLATHGYCTAEEVESARAAAPRIRLLDLPGLVELLKWGLVSGGVDDGCEPTAEEVAAEVDRMAGL